MGRVKLLVVEDETIVALDLQNNLLSLGYDVVGTAATGKSAIQKAIEKRPDLVLMDIMLKGEMDGVQAAEAIKERLNIPVIFLTACADDQTLQRAKITEPFGYVLKPYEERELHGHIEIALYKNRMERRLRESEERYSLATQGTNDGLWDWNVEEKKIYFSPRWKGMLGYADHQIGHHPEDWFNKLHPADKMDVAQKITEHLKGRDNHLEIEYRILDAACSYRWMLCRGLALRDRQGKVYRMAGSQTDITDRKVYSPITGLPNRTLLMDRLDRAVERASRSDSPPFAVMAVDIDGFRNISDGLGCTHADRLLFQIARRLQHCVQPQDTVAHLRDDDFVILLEEVKDATDATLVAARIKKELENPFLLEENKIYLTATIGITLSTQPACTAEEMVRDSYTAMHRAQDLGKGSLEIFDREMHSVAIASLQLEADLRKALAQGEFELYYQPIVCFNSARLIGFEALVRWQRQAGLALPKDFLPLAESTDLILPLERWSLRQACAQLSAWNTRVPASSAMSINVNLSAKHYLNPDLASELLDVLQETRLDPRFLRLEITESTLMEDSVSIAERIKRIRELGIQIHMDDFGTGYSSLSYLHRFPIDALKIDRCFVSNIENSGSTRKIVASIVTLARQLSMEVIAEGVENSRQYSELGAIGCDFGQGFFFSKPLDVDSVDVLLTRDPPWQGKMVSQDSQWLEFAAHSKD